MCAQLFQLHPTLATPWTGARQAPLSIALSWQEYWSRLSFPSPLFEYFCCSVAQLCLALCDPMDCSTPGLLVPHHLPRFAQVHVHCISDAVQPSHPLSPPSPPALNLFQWVSPLHQVAKRLELQLQHQSFQWILKVDFLKDKLVWSPCRQGTLKSLLQHYNLKAWILQHSAFFMDQVSHLYMTTEKTIVLNMQTFTGKDKH